MKTITIVIPARLASTRLPEKPLADINGKPMIQHVYERAQRVSGVSRVVVATDHQRIIDAVAGFGGEAVMTATDLQSGTDRVGAVATLLPGAPGDIFVNVQGDEPLVDPVSIQAAIDMVRLQHFAIGTCAAPLPDLAALQNPNVVKVLIDKTGRAIYFSRFPIPYSRVQPSDAAEFIPLQHQGIYAYTRESLALFCHLPRVPPFLGVSPSTSPSLEVAESLEQLRALINGIAIGVARVKSPSIGVDTLADLELARKLS